MGIFPIIVPMAKQIDFSKDTIRDHLLARAKAFSAFSGMSLSAISSEAVKDSKFLPEVDNGKKTNFTLATYQRVIDWIDAHEADPVSSRRAGSRASLRVPAKAGTM